MSGSREGIAQDDPAAVLDDMRRKGIAVWVENGQLRYRAPRGTITNEDLKRLSIDCERLVTFLRGHSVPHGKPSFELDEKKYAPASFSQLAHWNLYRLGERPAVRQIASATKLRGVLDMDAMRGSLSAMVSRHWALRTRIVVLDGSLIQEIIRCGECPLHLIDISDLPQAQRETRVREKIEDLILQPIDPGVGPLFEVCLMRLSLNEHVLIVVMEHMISDAFSMGVFLSEIFAAYGQLVGGNILQLPPVAMQFAEYSIQQRSNVESWLKQHDQFWRNRLAGCERLKFPSDVLPSELAGNKGWGYVTLNISRDLKQELSEWSRARRTTLVLAVFTAYVALLLRWCKVSDALVLLQTDGRFAPELMGTIGYISSVLYLRVQLGEEDTFLDILDRVTDEYCQAYAHADSSYLESQVPNLPFTRNSRFNWVPQHPYSFLGQAGVAVRGLTPESVPFLHPMRKKLERDTEPSIQLFESDEVYGELLFPLDRFYHSGMERFVRSLLLFIRTLSRQPGKRVQDMPLL